MSEAEKNESTTQIITKTCNVEGAETVAAIVRGTATPEQIEKHNIRVMQSEIETAVNESGWVDSASDDYRSGWNRVKVELEDDAYLGWVANDKQQSFFGSDNDGDEWAASINEKKTVEVEGKSVSLVLTVESR